MHDGESSNQHIIIYMEYMVHDGESLNQHIIIYGIYGA